MTARSDRRSYRGTHVSVVEARQALAKAPAGRPQALPPSATAVREALDGDRCPFCGRGPYRSVAVHTVQAHGVSGVELRAMAGLVKHARICSDGYSERKRSDLVGRGDFARGEFGPRERRRAGAVLEWSEAGLAAQRANGRSVAGRVATDAQCRASKINGDKRGQQLRKPRQPCTECGAVIPYVPGNARKRTCSAECLSASKSRRMAAQRRNGVLST